jgi:hypothetical protein
VTLTLVLGIICIAYVVQQEGVIFTAIAAAMTYGFVQLF